MNENVVYLDHAATTPLRPAVLEAMTPFLTERYGNPSGAHLLARRARRAVDDAREVLARALGAEPGDIVFTGGGTEADNLAVLGVLDAMDGSVEGRVVGRVVGRAVCPATEHHAVLHPVQARRGRVVAVSPDGIVDLDALAGALDPGVAVVSVMLANNEIGVVQTLADVAELVRERSPQAVLHTDAVQAFPWLDVAALATPADMVSVSAHKFGGPQGVGALVVRPGVRLAPRALGGGQERERRSGTHNVAGIVGMAEAARLTVQDRKAVIDAVAPRRDALADGLLAAVPGSTETGNRATKIAGNCHLCFDGVESEALLFLMEAEGICASAASSCASGAQDPSHVLAALGLPRARALGSLRLSLGPSTTDAEVDHALAVIPPAVARLREVGS